MCATPSLRALGSQSRTCARQVWYTSMHLKMRESAWCHFHASREIQKRESNQQQKHGLSLVSAMLIEGKAIDLALAGMQIPASEKLSYIAQNSVLVKASDGGEAIQIIWFKTKAICIHRLLTKELRNDFDANWLGVTTENVGHEQRPSVIENAYSTIKKREALRGGFCANGELMFFQKPESSRQVHL